MGNLIFKFIEWLMKWLIPPIVAEVSYLQYEEIRNNPSDRLVVITPWPRRYHVNLALTNRSSRVVYIKQMSLTISGGKTYQATNVDDQIRLNSHERKLYSEVFDVGDDEQPRTTGEYEIMITPTVGRQTKVSGTFPLGG